MIAYLKIPHTPVTHQTHRKLIHSKIIIEMLQTYSTLVNDTMCTHTQIYTSSKIGRGSGKLLTVMVKSSPRWLMYKLKKVLTTEAMVWYGYKKNTHTRHNMLGHRQPKAMDHRSKL